MYVGTPHAEGESVEDVRVERLTSPKLILILIQMQQGEFFFLMGDQACHDFDWLILTG